MIILVYMPILRRSIRYIGTFFVRVCALAHKNNEKQ